MVLMVEAEDEYVVSTFGLDEYENFVASHLSVNEASNSNPESTMNANCNGHCRYFIG